MRILNRPMFRYGGPIKEGVMHGMRDGGRTLAGGNQIGTPMGNRTGFANPKDKLIMGAATKILPKLGLKPGFMKPWWSKIKNIFGSTSKHTPVTQVTKPAVTKWSGPYSGTVPGGTTWQGGAVQKVWTPSGWVARDPLYKLGSAAWAGKGVLGKPLKWAGKTIATPTGGIGLVYIGGKWLTRDGKPANENEINEHLSKGGGKSGGVPGGGDQGMKGTGEWFAARDAEAAKKLAKDAQNKRLKSYLDMMGYDSSKKTAMSDALIDASALVQDATTEAGSIKHADWSKLINRAIQTTSKRLDKPAQIREAVGLMATKAAIQKDLEDPQVKELRALQIEEKEKLLNAGPSALITAHMASRKGSLDAKDLAILMRDYGIQNDIPVGVITKTQVTEEYGKDGKPAMDIIEEKKITEDGIYVIGKEVIQITGGKPLQLA